MRATLLLILLSAYSHHLSAQLYGKKDLLLSQGVMNFNYHFLKNKSNTNNRLSWVTELDRHLNISRLSSMQYGIGLGNHRNADTLFRPYDNNNFFRIKLGLLLHLPQKHTAVNWSPNPFNPFVKLAYNFDIMGKAYKETTGSGLSSSVKIALGSVIKLNHCWGIYTEISHNQRVSQDYRTFVQYNLGIMYNLDKPYTSR